MTEAYRRRLDNLEGPIADALLMASITASIMVKFSNDLMGYKKAPNMPAPRLVEEMEDSCEQVQYATYRLEEMLRDLKAEYLAPIDEEAS